MPTITHAAAAALCAGTPVLSVRDNRGLTVRTVRYNRDHPTRAADERITSQHFTATGQLLSSIDPRLFDASRSDDKVLPNFRHTSSLSGRALRAVSQDAGPQITVHDIEGAPVWRKDGRDHFQGWAFDALHRPVELRERDVSGKARIRERYIYGETEPAAFLNNSRGQLVRQYDPAGLNEMPSFGTSGRALRSVRRLLADPIALSDWADDESRWPSTLETVSYESRSSYNALGMVERSIDAMGNAQQQVYNVAGQLASSSLRLKAQDEQPILGAITYSAAGKVLEEVAGNGIVTRYAYEPQTQRLDRLLTTRPSQAGRAALLQDLGYTHDPVGNILSITDAAVPTRFHDNQRLDATSTYSYDALYQLSSATGRENADVSQQTHALPSLIVMDGDAGQLSNYTRHHTYDRGGNLTHVRHQGNAPFTSEMRVSPTSNHAVPRTGGLGDDDVEAHFDACGNPRQLAPGQPLMWDSRNQLQQVTQVQRAGADDDRETYQYDGGGRRIRKTGIAITSATVRTAEVLYLPGIEIRRTQSNATVVEELHVVTLGAAGRQAVRVLHWETGQPADIPNDQLRYSLGNEIGSSMMELDGNADILTLEAYYPYGGTAVWSGRNDSETKYKFVRYSGKERDATGLYFYGARYYAPWMQRWLNPDPAGPVDGLNLLRMARNNPVTLHDADGRRPTKADEKMASITESFTPAELGLRTYRNQSVDVQDITFETMEIAAGVMSDLSIHMKYGRGNQLADIERTQGESHLRAQALRAEKTSSMFDIASRSLAYQAGNCGEYALATMLLLSARLHPAIPLQEFLDEAANHTFVLAGDRRVRDAELVVVDSWAVLPIPHLLRQGIFTPTTRDFGRSAIAGYEWGDEVWSAQAIPTRDITHHERIGQDLVNSLKHVHETQTNTIYNQWVSTKDPGARFQSPRHPAARFDMLPESVVARYTPSMSSAPEAAAAPSASPGRSRFRSFLDKFIPARR